MLASRLLRNLNMTDTKDALLPIEDVSYTQLAAAGARDLCLAAAGPAACGYLLPSLSLCMPHSDAQLQQAAVLPCADRLPLHFLGAQEKQVAERMAGCVANTITCLMLCIGDKAGLFTKLNELGPSTPAQLAQAAGLSERWVREWLYQQVGQ